jgi:cobalt-zinc-cadmium efflux system protein
MKSQKRILTAFVLNLIFAVFEFIGGALTGSVAIISDSVHDFGDSVSIGISYILEEKSKKEPDDKYTFGYGRYSVLGSLIMTVILIVGSIFVIIHACDRIIHPAEIDYNGMLLFAAFGMGVNFIAAVATRGDGSLNQQAVSLHMFEDVLGWGVVLLGAILMKFTDITYIDPIMSIGVAIFLLVHAFKHFKEICDIFFEKTPHDIDISEIKHHLKEIDGVLDVHHIHVWSMDGNGNYATMHIVTDSDQTEIKRSVKEALHDRGIVHATLETETEQEKRTDEHCRVLYSCEDGHHHHHHHHHRR